ncbi:polyprenyl synthetase family protein [Clostridium tarantellae]|uniref:Farnesyl diphosphate synthase n=1 Tax=Clostridium tarantellae TaxID=39493 RepID=A0A6I1MJ72_9CLOT|nr:farnesyl diphosphate synthase [Clostridium tarantellae]MPQ42753.1 polyprenyl synthetase family protein [Clostridium tarantellae]
MNFDALKVLIDKSLEEYFLGEKSYNKKLYEAMAYSVNIGGKRIRPIIMLLSYYIYKNDYETILPASLALEMIHTYSLIHDDLPCMDNDDLRRGMPTNHKVFGEAVAVLAGDALLNEAMNILLKFSLERDIQALKASKEILEAAGAEGMIGGQIVDIINEGNKEKISLEELNYMHLKKTGELIKSSVIAGAILANASEKDIDLLRDYGYKLGLAFQIKDDILDVISTTEDLGKNVKSDIDNDKTNYVSLFGVEECQRKCNILTEECLNILDSIDGNITPLKEITLSLLHRKY